MNAPRSHLVEEWAARYLAGCTIKELADASQYSTGTVHRMLRLAGVPMRHRSTKSKPALVRFYARISPEPNTGCWLWAHGVSGQRGHQYGCFKHGHTRSAHVASYLLHKGDIPHGMCVCHSCDQTLCVNPDHLFLGTQKDNVRDCYSKGRGQKHQSAKTHCPNGHEYAGDNLHIRPDGARRCRACARDGHHARKKRSAT